MTEVFYFEDWLIYMLNNSDYRENELMQFEEHYQNLLDYNQNTDNFKKYFQEKLKQIDSKTELTDREIEDGAFEHFSHHSREYEYFIKACKWYRYQIKHKQ